MSRVYFFGQKPHDLIANFVVVKESSNGHQPGLDVIRTHRLEVM